MRLYQRHEELTTHVKIFDYAKNQSIGPEKTSRWWIQSFFFHFWQIFSFSSLSTRFIFFMRFIIANATESSLLLRTDHQFTNWVSIITNCCYHWCESARRVSSRFVCFIFITAKATRTVTPAPITTLANNVKIRIQIGTPEFWPETAEFWAELEVLALLKEIWKRSEERDVRSDEGGNEKQVEELHAFLMKERKKKPRKNLLYVV